MSRNDIEEEEREEAGAGYSRFQEDSLRDALMRQWGAAPWYVGSFGIHMVIFAILLLFAPDPAAKPKAKVKVTAAQEEEIPPEEPEPEPEEIVEPEEVVDENVEITNEVSVDTAVEVETEVTETTSEEVAVDTSDFTEADYDAQPTLGLTAVSAASGKGGGKFGNRKGKGRAGALKRAKVGRASTTALALGLAWLAKVQEEDGHWNSSKYSGKGYDPSVTALALLAFLGDGNSSKSGKYKMTVRQAQTWLANRFKQNERRIGGYSYEAAITMMAMSEAWAMSEDPALQPIVQAQIDLAQEVQGTNGGWGYNPTTDPEKAHVDSSVTGWWVMGLKSAKVAGGNIDEKCWNKAIDFFKSVAVKQGNLVGTSYQKGNDFTWHRNLTSVGLTCLQFLGLGREHELVKGQAEMILAKKWMMGAKGMNPDETNFYGWYYQALGCFQMGVKSPYWKEYNKAVEPLLVNMQEKEGFNRGSWSSENSKQNYENHVGRVGITATACLMLEVAYRYEDAHKKSK